MDPELEMTTDEAIDAIVSDTARKREIDAELRNLNARIDASARLISGAWLLDGTQKITRNGATIFLSREMTVSTPDTAAAVAAFMDAGMEWALAVGSGRLKSWLKEILYNAEIGEWTVDEDRIPPEIRGKIDVREYHRVNVRGATRAATSNEDRRNT